MGRRDASAIVIIAITAGTGLVALGGAPRWAACLTAALGLASALPYLTSRRGIDARAPLLALLGLAAAATALQCAPLPAGLVAWLSPARHAVAADTAAALGVAPPGFVALSYDPPATLVALATLCGQLALAYAAARVAASARGRLWLARIAAVAGAALAMCGLAHRGLGMDALFGVYQPAQATPAYPAPLLNDNHLAGFLSLTAPLALVLAAASAGAARLAWVSALAAIAATNLLVGSRGGAVSLAVGLGAAVILLVARHRQQPGRRPARARLIPAGIVVACGVTLVGALATDRIRDELSRTSMDELDDPRSKFGVWRAALVLVSENPWTGVGRGGFEPAFTRLHERGTKTYSHVENEYLQAIVDWGVPAGAGLLVCAAWLLWRAVRRPGASVPAVAGARGDPVAIGALAALAALAAHVVTDFHLELPGVAATAIAVLAVRLPARVRRGERSRSRLLLPRLAALAAGAIVVTLAASPAGRSAREHEAAVVVLLDRARAAAEGGERAGARAHLDRAVTLGRDAVARHPADYLLAGLLARVHFQQRDPRAVRWINRALALNPRHPGLRVLAARMLLTAGRRDQALIELRLALRYTLTPRAILEDLLRWFPDPDQAALGIPARRERLPVISSWLRAMDRADVALAHARRVYRDHRDDLETQRIVAELAWMQRDAALAVEAGRPAYARSGHLADAIVLGQALHATGRLDEAERVLDQALEGRRYDAPWQLARAHVVLSDVHASAGDDMSARASLRTAIRLLPERTDAAVRADLYRRLARIEERLGNPRGAAQARAEARAAESR